MTEERLEELNKLKERIDDLKNAIANLDCNVNFDHFSIYGVCDDGVKDYLFDFDNPKDWKIGQELTDLKDLRDVILNHLKSKLAALEKEFEEG